jgi:hypothetical protein
MNFLGKQSSTGHSLLTMQMGIWVRWIFFCQKIVCLPVISTAETHYERVLGSSHEDVASQVASMYSTHNGVTFDYPHKSSKVTGNMDKNNPDTLVIRTVFNYVSTTCIIQTLSPAAHSTGGQSPPNVHNLKVQNLCLSSGVPFDSQMFHNLSHIQRGYVYETPLGEYL